LKRVHGKEGGKGGPKEGQDRVEGKVFGSITGITLLSPRKDEHKRRVGNKSADGEKVKVFAEEEASV